MLPGFTGVVELTTATVELTTATVELLEDEATAPLTGQIALFSLPPIIPTETQRPSPSETGQAGQALFRAACSAHGLGYLEPPDPAHKGFDCFVEGKRIQVKTTARRHAQGFRFTAGSGKRFASYRDTCDLFAFVIAANSTDYYGRMRLMEAGVVINRWPGRDVYLQPNDFPRYPNLILLIPQITDAVIEDLVASK